MPDLSIQVAAAKVVPFAAAPTLAFQLRDSQTPSPDEDDSHHRAALPDPD